MLNAYEKVVSQLNELRKAEQECAKEIEVLKRLEKENFVTTNPAVSFLGLSSSHSENLKNIIGKSILQINKYIQNEVHSFIEDNSKNLQLIQAKIQDIVKGNDYIAGKSIFEDNKALSEIIKKLNVLNEKFTLINKETEIAHKMQSDYKDIGQKLLELHISYLDKINNIASEMRLQHEDVNLSSEITLKPDLERMLNECISLRSTAMNDLVTKVVFEYQKRTKADIINCIKDLLNKAIRNEISFKNGYDTPSFVSKILSECWFGLRFNVEYDGDNLRDMSPGKRSFVILKLLLDFSDKKCPILIDQPEDNLDNRAIYNELVKYIKKKKRERQIILVTHNPNIVVGADSEEVIVANQNGKNAPNEGGIKFQYVFGSLENSKKRVNQIGEPILECCGIREHVCDILEGGEDAFRDRENKYGFHKI